MALNPDVTTRIIKRNSIGVLVNGWDTQKLLWSIEEQAKLPNTTPKSFVDWFLAQVYDSLKLATTEEEWRKLLILEIALRNEQLTIPEDVKNKHRKILLIEAYGSFAALYGRILLKFAENYDISLRKQDITFRDFPPANPSEFTALLDEHSGAYLHNLAPKDLKCLLNYVQANPHRKDSIVVVRNSTSSSPEHKALWAQLEEKGIQTVPKLNHVVNMALLKVLGLESLAR